MIATFLDAISLVGIIMASVLEHDDEIKQNSRHKFCMLLDIHLKIGVLCKASVVTARTPADKHYDRAILKYLPIISS